MSQHVNAADNFPLDYINKNMNRLQRDETYHLHCLGGYRSLITASILKSRGFHNIVDIIGGWRAIEATEAPLTDYVCPSTMAQETIDDAVEAVA